MSSHDAWLLSTGHHHPRTSYERVYWDRLAEPSIFVPLLVLLATILYTTNILEFPQPLLSAALGDRLWDLVVRATPPSLLFSLDDWLSPFPLPRPPMDRASPAVVHNAKSSALSRIFGRDRPGGGGGVSGIISSVSYAGKSRISRLMPKGALDRPAGLGNLSNSCYQNSILQALTALAPLRDYLADIIEEEETGGLPPVEAAHTLGLLVRDLYGPLENGETLWTPPVLKRMSTFQQQDAQEYFCKLLNEVQEEVERALKAVRKQPGFETDIGIAPGDELFSSHHSLHSEDSGYQSASSMAKQATAVASSFRIPLEGLVAQRIVCRSCEYSSGISMSPFYCLTLNLGFGSPEYRLEETLDSFSGVESIEGVQCARCTLLKFRDRIRVIIGRIEAASSESPEATKLKHHTPYERLQAVEAALEDEDFEEKTLSGTCKVPDKQRVEATKTRQVGIARAPPSIAFHINRSRFDENTGYTFKNPAAVRFPLRLDLGPWCLGSAASRSSLSGGHTSEKAQAEKTDGGASNSSEKSGGESEDVSFSKSSEASFLFSQVSHIPVDDEEQWQLPPQLPMVAGTQQHSKITGPFYELRAVITHYGQHENGHYVCYRKHPAARKDMEHHEEKDHKNTPPHLVSESDGNNGHDTNDSSVRSGAVEVANADEADETADADDGQVPEYPKDTETAEPQWWRLSDQNVTLSDEATVLSQGGVFMLFYDRIDASSVFIGDSADSRDCASIGADASFKNSEIAGGEQISAEDEAKDSNTGTKTGAQSADDVTDTTPIDGKKISHEQLEAALAEAQATSAIAS